MTGQPSTTERQEYEISTADTEVGRNSSEIVRSFITTWNEHNINATMKLLDPGIVSTRHGAIARTRRARIFMQPAVQYVPMPRSRTPARGAEGCLVCPGLPPDRHWHPEALSLGRPRSTPLGPCETHFVHGRQTPHYLPSSGGFSHDRPQPPACLASRPATTREGRILNFFSLKSALPSATCGRRPHRRSTARSSAPSGWRGSWPARRLTRWQEN